MIGFLAAAMLAAFGPSGPTETPEQPLTEQELEAYPEARGMPADAQRFMVKWHGCAHWLGEPGWNEERRRQIEQGIAEACPGVDEQGRQVFARHAGDAEVMARLAEYEPLGY